MSSSTNVNVAEEYAGDTGIVLEMQMGIAGRGASIDWLSQYPHEKEVLCVIAACSFAALEILGPLLSPNFYSTQVRAAHRPISRGHSRRGQADHCEAHSHL